MASETDDRLTDGSSSPAIREAFSKVPKWEIDTFLRSISLGVIGANIELQLRNSGKGPESPRLIIKTLRAHHPEWFEASS